MPVCTCSNCGRRSLQIAAPSIAAGLCAFFALSVIRACSEGHPSEQEMMMENKFTHIISGGGGPSLGPETENCSGISTTAARGALDVGQKNKLL